jgi:dipeptidyl-peptidase 4
MHVMGCQHWPHTPGLQRPAAPYHAPVRLTPIAFLSIVACGGSAAVTPMTTTTSNPAAPAASPGSPTATAAWPAVDEAFIEQFAATKGFSLGAPLGLEVTRDGDAVLFRRTPPRSFVGDLYSFEVASGQVKKLLSAEDLLGGTEEKLSVEEKARRERMRQSLKGITGFSLSDDSSQILVPLAGRLFLVDRLSGKSRELAADAAAGGFPIDARFSPDGKRVALVRDGDLRVIDVAANKETRLTHKSGEATSNGAAEFVAQEEMDRFAGYWWSPDSAFLAYQHTDESKLATWTIADATHPEHPATSFRYPPAGGVNATVTLGVIPARGGKTVWVEWDRAKYPYLVRVAWDENAPLTIAVMNRTQTDEVVYAVDPKSGKTTQLLAEHDDAWIDLGIAPTWLPDGSGFLWETERNGAWQLELRGRDGALVRALTPPDFGLHEVAGFDKASGTVWLTGSDDPTQYQVWKVAIAGGAPVRVTSGDGVFTAKVSERGGTYVLAGVTRTGDRSMVVHRADGTAAGSLPSVAEEPPWMPKPEWTTVEVGGRTHHAVVIRPRDFDPSRRYPVIVSTYAGPTSNVVWANARMYLDEQWEADAGFIVVAMDGRGTMWRGRDWLRVVKNDLITVALSDQADILKALGAKYPELDLSRAGMEGWSFGGYISAMAALLRPDVFKATIAGAPVTDWRLYDTFYTERYMGLPEENAAGYASTSALTHADKLGAALLLIHGTTDDNVYFTHSLVLSQALFRAGKLFEFLPLAGFTHMVPDPVVSRALALRKIAFFRTHLQ